MRAPASTGTNKLPTLEDNSQTSNSAHTSQGHNSKSYNSHSHNSSRQGSRDGSNNSHSGEGSSINKPRGMKRSPYLSVMAGSTKESEDLVALLSRPRSNSSATQKKLDEILPTGGVGGKEGGKESSTGASVLMEKMNVDDDNEPMGRGELIGVGGVIGNKGLSHGVNLSNTNQQQQQLPGSDAFFNLKRPSNKPPPQSNSSGGGGFELNRNRSTTPSVTPVSSGGTEFTNAEYDESGSGSGSASNQGSGSGDARMKPPPQPSSNNRGLGIGPQLKSALRIGGSRSNLQETPSTTSNMGRSNVSFSNTTKMASTKGLTSFPDTVDGNKYGNATFNFGTNTGGSVQAKQVAQMRQFQIGGSGSSGGGQGMGMGGAKYSAQNMMRKSQSIAAPQFMLTHTQSIGSKSGTIDSRGNSSSANESFNIASSSGQSVATNTTGNSGGSGGSGEVVGQSFPIFLGKLSTPSDKQQQKSQQQQPLTQPKHVRQRSQSTTTLKYYASHNQNTSCIQKDPAQQLLQAAGMTGIATTRTSTLNLTFREMLDEGDGTENDLNSRLRNQQWKDFSNFSNQFEKSNPMLRSVDEHSSTGSKDSSMGECSSASTGTGAGGRRKSSMGSQMSLSGSKRSIGSGGSSGGASSGGSIPNSRGNQQWQRPYGLAGSHRQAVSVNDLAVLRRAASRMKMNNVTGGGGGGMGSMGGMGVQKLPGETLGGSLLSRINSTADSSIGGSSHSGTATAPPTTILSPMEQMMARKQSQQQTTTQQPQTSEMFMKQFNLAMSSGPGQYSVQPSPSTVYNTTSSSGASMGRQVRSVGAGLAYGRVNMTTNANRLSRFNLGNMNRTNSRLSEISSAGSSSSRTGIGTPRGNEEWDLG